MGFYIPETKKKRVIIIGGGFAGISIARRLDSKLFQTVLIDKNNYHQFQPLIYQVASSGLEGASICFPLRRLFHKKKDFFFRMAEVIRVDDTNKTLQTSIGDITYDYLVVCAGATSNFPDNGNIRAAGIPMKTVEEAMYLRNRIIENFEFALNAPENEREYYRNIVIVGGGATGVEVAGIISEMCRFALPKNFKSEDYLSPRIFLISSKILGTMSVHASNYAEKKLSKMGISIIKGKRVVDYVDESVIMDDGSSIMSKLLIWVSGIKAITIDGIPETSLGRGGRILCDGFMRVKGMDNVFAAGDIALTSEEKYPDGHPQLAQVAIQQARLIADNLKAELTGKQPKQFKYLNLGSMATIGRNKAVADIGSVKMSGFFAWVLWMTVHLRSILGVRNKLLVLFDWITNYFNFRGSLRVLIFKGKR